MGIEPTRTALPELKNKRFGAMANPKCDWRVNFRGMWGNVAPRRDTSVCEVLGLKPLSRLVSQRPNAVMRPVTIASNVRVTMERQ